MSVHQKTDGLRFCGLGLRLAPIRRIEWEESAARFPSSIRRFSFGKVLLILLWVNGTTENFSATVCELTNCHLVNFEHSKWILSCDQVNSVN